MNRFIRILFPPRPEVLSDMCQQGFDDALQFLHRNNLISCTRCLAVQSTFVVQEAIPEAQEFDPECTECQQHRKVCGSFQCFSANSLLYILTFFCLQISLTFSFLDVGRIDWSIARNSLDCIPHIY